MADVKISALPAAGALAGADVLPLVQPAGTRKVAVSVLDSRWVSSTGGTVNGPTTLVNNNPSGGVFVAASALTVKNASGVAGSRAEIAFQGLISIAAGISAPILDQGNSYGGLEFYGRSAAGFLRRFYLGATLNEMAQPLAIGTNPATTGALRLANNQYLYARNQPNTGDIRLLGLDDTGVLRVANAGVYTALDGTVRVSASGGQVGFYGTTPIVRPTGTPAAATDPATTMALVNSLRASLIALGLIS